LKKLLEKEGSIRGKKKKRKEQDLVTIKEDEA